MRAEARLFCHHSVPRASTEPGAVPGMSYALKQLQLVKEMALVQLVLTQAKSLKLYTEASTWPQPWNQGIR